MGDHRSARSSRRSAAACRRAGRSRPCRSAVPRAAASRASLADTPVDYEALAETGAIMGSGGLVVLDDRDCMVEIARFFLRFTATSRAASARSAASARKRMLEILDRLCAGQGRAEDLGNLAELADRVSRTSLCGLGQTAPEPGADRRCATSATSTRRTCARSAAPPGAVPRSPTTASPTTASAARSARRCVPVDAIEYRPHERHAIDLEPCTRCDMCFEVCEDEAVEVVSGSEICATSPRAAERAS